MIKVDPKPMSPDLERRYHEKVRAPGHKWLLENPSSERRLPAHWREVAVDLADAFHRRCAYTATCIHYDGTVDHFVSIEEDRTKAYDWANFRYCTAWFNSTKKNARSCDILDPLLVEDGWFELSWPDLQMFVTDQCPEEHRAKAGFMLEKLGLRKSRRVIENRRYFRDLWRRDPNALRTTIEEQAPLVARAIRKHLEARSAPADSA